MIHTISLLLSHGGIKLLLFGFALVMRAVRANTQKSRRREAQLRGNTGISNFSPPAAQPAPAAGTPPVSSPPTATPKSAPAPKAAPTLKAAPKTSPWAANQNPFDEKKS